MDLALKNNVPVAMLLSGGYQKSNAGVIAESINNLYNKFNHIGWIFLWFITATICKIFSS